PGRTPTAAARWAGPGCCSPPRRSRPTRRTTGAATGARWRSSLSGCPTACPPISNWARPPAPGCGRRARSGTAGTDADGRRRQGVPGPPGTPCCSSPPPWTTTPRHGKRRGPSADALHGVVEPLPDRDELEQLLTREFVHHEPADVLHVAR